MKGSSAINKDAAANNHASLAPAISLLELEELLINNEVIAV